MTIREQALASNHSYGYQRRWNSDRAIRCATTERRDLIHKLMYRGSPEEIAEYILLHRKEVVSVEAVARVIQRLKRREAGYQCCLWPDSAFRVPAPPMRVVHRAAPRCANKWVQLNLDLFNNHLTKAA